MSTLEILLVDFDRAQRDYWCQVRQSEAFDIGNVSIPSNMCGMITGLFPIDCIRYKLLASFPSEMQHVTESYVLFLHSLHPSLEPLETTFEVQVDEQNINHLEFTCSVAILKDEGDLFCTIVHFLRDHQEPLIPHFPGDAVDDGFFKGELPDWPSDDALNDGKRFYLHLHLIFSWVHPDHTTQRSMLERVRYVSLSDSSTSLPRSILD
ncbi:hypothetical protein YC2023_090131 [Brassica napus]